MKIVNELVGPNTPDMLIDAHRPERHDLCLWIGIYARKSFQPILADPGEIGHVIGRVGADKVREFIEAARLHHRCSFNILGALL